MNFSQFDVFGDVTASFSFSRYVPPRRRWEEPSVELPQIPFAYRVKKCPKMEIVFDSRTSGGLEYKRVRYFGDVTIEDFFDNRKKYRQKVKHFRDGLRKVYYARDPIFRVPATPARKKVKGFDTDSVKGDGFVRVPDMTEEEHNEYLAKKTEENLKRAKTRLQEHILLNEYKWFLTFTFDDCKVDGHDIAKAMEKLQNWLTNKVQSVGLSYVLVPEYHPSSGRLHAHALVNGDLTMVDSGTRMVRGFNKPVKVETYWRMVAEGRVNPSNCRILRTIYNCTDWRNGFTTAIPVYGSKAALANYMTKYITKGNQKIFGKFFWASKNQKKYPDVEMRDVTEDAFWRSNGKLYGVAGIEIKIENFVVITHREQRMLDQISMMMESAGEVLDDAVV